MTYYDTIVIGAGIMGSSAAYFLSKNSGSKVLLLEQFDRLHKRGSSHGESRIIRYAYPEYFNTSLMGDAYSDWAQIETEANTKLYTKTGSLSIGNLDNQDIRSIIKNFDTLKIPYEILTSATITAKFPTIRFPEGYVGIYQADGGILNATKAVGTIQNLAERNGCTFFDNTPVFKISKQASSSDFEDLYRIETSRGVFVSRRCIVTAGSWSKKLIQDNTGTVIPLSSEKTTIGYFVVSNPEVYSSSRFPVWMRYDDKYPMVYGVPALEYPNMIKCAGDVTESCDPDTRTFEPDVNHVRDHAGKFLKTFFTGVSENPAVLETCMYTQSLDRQFVIDKLPHSGIVVGCGFSGHGFKMGPLVGKILAQLATTEVHPYPHVIPYVSLNRFKNKY